MYCSHTFWYKFQYLYEWHHGGFAFILKQRSLPVGDRITIVLDSANTEKLRNIQAKMIKTSPKSVSFSHVLNLVVGEGLKTFKV